VASKIDLIMGNHLSIIKSSLSLRPSKVYLIMGNHLSIIKSSFSLWLSKIFKLASRAPTEIDVDGFPMSGSEPSNGNVSEIVELKEFVPLLLYILTKDNPMYAGIRLRSSSHSDPSTYIAANDFAKGFFTSPE
jgi:hypothetical protein